MYVKITCTHSEHAFYLFDAYQCSYMTLILLLYYYHYHYVLLSIFTDALQKKQLLSLQHVPKHYPFKLTIKEIYIQEKSENSGCVLRIATNLGKIDYLSTITSYFENIRL